MPANTSTLPPLPGGVEDEARRRHTALRHRLLTGHWQRDLEQHMLECFSGLRASEIGRPDLSRNLFRTVVTQIAALYTQQPIVTNEEGDEVIEGLRSELSGAGLWQLEQRNQRYQIGMRESVIRVAAVGDPARLQYRVVPVDCCYMEALPDEPDEPALYVEARLRDMDGDQVWTWDVLDVRDPADPVYRVLLPDDEDTPLSDARDVSERYLGGDFSGDAYPYRFEDGRPFLPLALYHAQRTGRLFDWAEARAMVEGTLTVAVYWSFWGHILKSASWPQRYCLGAILRGQTARGTGNDARSSVEADPASILQFTADGTTSPQFGQWLPGGDPERLQLAISSFEQGLVVHYGISKAELEGRWSGDASGYAVSLRRSAIRETQRRFEPQNRRADLQLISRSAAIANRAGIGNYPEGGYSIHYPGLPMSREEQEQKVQAIRADLDAGIATPIDLLLAKRPGLTREAAEEALTELAAERRRLAALGITATPSRGDNA